MAGTKLMRIGKLQRWYKDKRNVEKWWTQLAGEAGNPAKRAYHQGKVDALIELLKDLDSEFDLSHNELEGGVLTDAAQADQEQIQSKTKID